MKRWLKRLFGSRTETRCQALCPGCRSDLNAAANLGTCTDADLVRFTCGKCGARSAWDFDAPAPLLIRLEEP